MCNYNSITVFCRQAYPYSSRLPCVYVYLIILSFFQHLHAQTNVWIRVNICKYQRMHYSSDVYNIKMTCIINENVTKQAHITSSTPIRINRKCIYMVFRLYEILRHACNDLRQYYLLQINESVHDICLHLITP